MSSVWAPVVAALGASLLTGLSTWTAASWVQRRVDRRAAQERRRESYLETLRTSSRLVGFAQELRLMLLSRTGISESIGVLLRLRRPLDTEALRDRYGIELTRILDAQAALATAGSQPAIAAGDRVAEAAINYLKASGAMTPAQRRWLHLRGWKPTDEQDGALQERLKELFTARDAFVHVLRRELNEAPVELGTSIDESP